MALMFSLGVGQWQGSEFAPLRVSEVGGAAMEGEAQKWIQKSQNPP